MNLRTASLLCERFLSCVGDGELFDQLGDVLAKGSAINDATIDGGEAPQDTIDDLTSAAKKALSSYDKSLFVDPAMKIFPEYTQLGFAGIMAGDFEKCLKSLCDTDGGEDDFAANLARIGREGEGISELTNQIERLMAVANYFGVESRDDFESDAIGVIQMPKGEAGENASGNVDAFVERMQSFESIVEFCGVNDENGGNIRMIAADDALVVADLSSEGGHKLQKIISEVKSAKSDIAEIENASERLKDVGVNDKIIDMLGEETGLIRKFDESKAGSFISSLLSGENSVTGKWMANAIMSLLDSGVRIDSVALKPYEPDEASAVATEMAVVANALEALDEETATNDTTGSETSDQADKTNENDQVGEGDETSETNETNETNEPYNASGASVVSGAAVLANANSFAAKNGLGVAKPVVDSVMQEAADLTDAASDKVSEIKDDVCDLANDASEKVDEVVETASDAVSKTAEKLSTVVDDAGEAVSNGVSNGVDKVSDTVSDSVDKVAKSGETRYEAEKNAARARKKNLRSLWETFSGRN